ncbi:MAG: FecR domain-containing protein [Reinekea sp.]
MPAKNLTEPMGTPAIFEKQIETKRLHSRSTAKSRIQLQITSFSGRPNRESRMRLLSMLFFLCISPLAIANDIAVVVQSSGKVIRSTLDAGKTTLQSGLYLAEKDLITTGENASSIIKFADQSVLVMDENTRVLLSRFNPEPDGNGKKMVLELLYGRLQLISGSLSKANAFELRSAHATIGVRGTEFEVISSASQTRVIHYRGTVLVSSVDSGGELLELTASHRAAVVSEGTAARYLPDPIGHGPISTELLALVNSINAPPLVSAPLVLPLSANGAVPLNGLDGQPVEPIAAFVIAVNEQQWALARTLANELMDRFEGLPRFDLYYGILLVHEQSFDEAIFAFERVLIFNPQQHRARLELGRAYYMLQNYVRAKEALEQVLAANPPDQITQTVYSLLQLNDAAMRRSQEQTLFGGKVLFGWDSNANLGSSVDDGELDPNLLGLTSLAEISKPIDSAFIQWSVMTGLIQPTSQNSSHQYRLEYSQKQFVKSNITDTSSLTGLMQLNKSYDKQRYSIPISSQFSWNEGRWWQNTTNLGATREWRIWGPLWAGVNIATEINLSLNEDNNSSVRDSAGIVLNAQERARIHSLSSRYLQTQIAGLDDEHEQWQGLANRYQLNWRMPWSLSAFLSAEHQWRYFQADDLFFTVSDTSTTLKRRQDQVVDALFNTSWTPNQWLQTSLVVEWHQVASNINAYCYKQWIASSAIKLRF